jgi:hypothetical protein
MVAKRVDRKKKYCQQLNDIKVHKIPCPLVTVNFQFLSYYDVCKIARRGLFVHGMMKSVAILFLKCKTSRDFDKKIYIYEQFMGIFIYIISRLQESFSHITKLFFEINLFIKMVKFKFTFRYYFIIS